ncbi:MAG: ATP-binding protein [Pseudomonadota bacterium]|nr:ATP-binding protein [Pseudomonadota bacterium]
MPGLNGLRWRLLLLVAVAIAPMAAMTVAVGERERAHALAGARENLQRLANLAAANEAQSLDGARQILRDLSSVPAVVDRRADCGAVMADILSKNADYVNFGLIELDGNVSCSAVPLSAPVNLGDRLHFKRAIAERRFIAGNYVFGRVVQKHTVNVTYPVIRGNDVVAVLFAAIDLSELDKFVTDVKLPAGSLLWTIDAAGTVISRRPDPRDWFGKNASPALARLAATRPEPVVLRDTDQVERMYAAARVGPAELTEYSVLIGVPQDAILAAARRDQAFALSGLALTVLLAALAAWFGGDLLIARRVRSLAVTANLIASGSLGTRTGLRYGREEIGELARSLDDMAQALEAKEAERDQVQALLIAADQRKDEFLAMLAHELRNPLAPISAGAQLLQHMGVANPAIARTAEIIARQVVHMTRLVDDLLDVSRVTRGFVKLDKQRLQMADVIADALEQINPAIQKKGQQLMLDLPRGACAVAGDHKRMVQIVANLINNAAKYTPAGGRIRVALLADERQVTLRVADNGIGMPAELVARVFDLFAQGERTSDRSEGGLGLGLALVKTLVVLHGGSVKAESAGVGQGSTFTVALPLPPADGAAAGAAALHAPGAVDVALRCLLVDDNVDATHMLSLFLEAKGYTVAVAHSAAEALVLAPAFHPELCLLDIGLPDMDGIELVARLRRLPETAGALMIAVTGYGRQQDREIALAAGFDHYFIKPLDTDRLMQLVALPVR